jgi:hypothetical protein
MMVWPGCGVAAINPPQPGQGSAGASNAAVLIRSINSELQRLGCYAGVIDDDWNSAAAKRGISGLERYANLPAIRHRVCSAA